MEAKELRIGNLLMGYDKITFEWGLKEFELHSQGVFVDEIGMPLPITEEILLKFGFEKCEGQYGIYFKSPHDKQVRIYFYDEKWCIGYVSDYPTGFSTIGSFIYVHKLQNFHYELVGKELELVNN